MLAETDATDKDEFSTMPVFYYKTKQERRQLGGSGIQRLGMGMH